MARPRRAAERMEKMTNDDRNLHTCNYWCMRPECILQQRNELRDRVLKQKPTLWALKDNPGITTRSKPQMEQLWDALGPMV
jgi:hypothetical protein